MFVTDRNCWSAAIGGLAWCVICLAPVPPNLGIGTIEKLFLLAPLTIVPLGLGLVGVRRVLGVVQSLAAAAVVASFFFPQGLIAGVMVVPWLALLAFAALNGLFRQVRNGVTGFCFAAALLCLTVGGVGLLQSRFGMMPLGFREPLVLLVAVHFHYAAFVSPVIAGLVIQRTKWLGWPTAIATSMGSPILAMGYILGVPVLRLLGAILLGFGLCTVALLTLTVLGTVRPRLAQLLLTVSAISVVAAMAYAGVYAMADFSGEVWIAIPHMARTHGVINALGFSLCGFWGWSLVANKKQKLSSLTRRW